MYSDPLNALNVLGWLILSLAWMRRWMPWLPRVWWIGKNDVLATCIRSGDIGYILETCLDFCLIS